MTPERALRLIDEHETLQNAFRTFLATDGRELAMQIAVRVGVRKLAERIGVDPSRVSRVINRHESLTGDMLVRILSAEGGIKMK